MHDDRRTITGDRMTYTTQDAPSGPWAGLQAPVRPSGVVEATPEEPSVRSRVLRQAEAAVTTDRNRTYGPPEDAFRVIADYWSVHLGRPVSPSDVSVMLALMKVARLRGNRTHADGWIDLAGYAACGYEVALSEVALSEEGVVDVG